MEIRLLSLGLVSHRRKYFVLFCAQDKTSLKSLTSLNYPIFAGNFNTVIAMNARSSIYDAPERAEKVLRRYRDLCSQNVLRNKPDEYSYSLLLKVW
jgi:hypothetical protein